MASSNRAHVLEEASGAALGAPCQVSVLGEGARGGAEAGAFYRALFDQSFQFCVVLDADGRVLEANAAALALARVQAGEVVGAPLSATPWWRRDPAVRARVQEAVERALGGAFLRFETFVDVENGARIPFDLSIKPILDDAGAVAGVIVEGRDISDKQRSEAALRESEERYRNLYWKAPVMLHSVDASGRLLSVSDRWLERLGYARDEVIGRPVGDFVSAHPGVLDASDADVDCADCECVVSAKDGERIDALLSTAAERDPAGAVRRVMAVLTDVTERKRIERQLNQAQKMESVGQLTGGLAHDFNNLLAVILGNLQLIERAGKGDGELERRAKTALGAVARGAELTRRLLAFSRRQNLEPEAFDPDEMVRSLSDILQRALGERVDLRHAPAAEPTRIWADRNSFETSVLNLALNARDAMPDGGALVITTDVVRLEKADLPDGESQAPGAYVRVSVSDTGLGVPPEFIEHVFEPFFTTKETGQGSGLGLSMVYGFTRQSGGQALIESAPGRGATVRMLFPLYEGAARALARASEAAAAACVDGDGALILVVEDQDDVREVAEALMADLGYRTLSAPSAKAGLAALDAHPDVALLFTDVIMPGGMDGPALAVEARRRFAHLPIVFATGFAQASELREAQDAVGAALVTKPYSRSDLSSKIRAALDQDAAGARRRGAQE